MGRRGRNGIITPSLDDYYKAGAWFRLLKQMLSEFTLETPKLIGLYAKETDKMTAFNNRFYELEIKCGFESHLEKDHGKELNNADFCDMFYGSMESSDSITSTTEREIRKQALTILETLAESIRQSLDEK